MSPFAINSYLLSCICNEGFLDCNTKFDLWCPATNIWLSWHQTCPLYMLGTPFLPLFLSFGWNLAICFMSIYSSISFHFSTLAFSYFFNLLSIDCSLFDFFGILILEEQLIWENSPLSSSSESSSGNLPEGILSKLNYPVSLETYAASVRNAACWLLVLIICHSLSRLSLPLTLFINSSWNSVFA